MVPNLTAAETAWGTLDRMIQSGNVEHRIEAVAAIGYMDPSDELAMRHLRDALKDKDPRVRREACLAFGQMKAKQAIPDLQSALDDDGEVAFAAAKSLMDMGDESGRHMLVAVLAGERKDQPGMVTNAVRDAQKRLRHPQGILMMGVEDAAGAMFGPAGMGITAAKDALAMKGSGAPGRSSAVAYLAKDPDPYAVTLMEWALGDDNYLVRLEAAKGLGKRGTKDSIAKLEPLLQDGHTSVRAMAASAMLRIQGRNGEADTADRQK